MCGSPVLLGRRIFGARFREMDAYSVYKHTAPSGRVYIGVSKNPEKRWNRGRGYMYNPYFWRCIQKYGWDNIKHEILFSGISLESAKAKEVELIAEFRANEREFGYNISGGGDGLTAEESREKMSRARMGNKNSVGRKISQEVREKISSSLKKYYSSHNQYFLGKHHKAETIDKLKARVFTEETRRKMRRNHKNVTGANNPSARSVECLAMDGTLVKVYSFAKQAADDIGADLSSIIKCCRGKQKSCKGLRWRYREPSVFGWREV